MSQVIEALQWRYAVKKFDSEKKLTNQQLDTVKEAFNLTATSYGLQPIRLVIIEDKTLQEKLVSASMNQRQVADCSHLLVICIEKVIDGDYVKSYFKRVKDIRDTPDEILKPFRDYLLDVFKKDSDEETALWASKQAYLAMGNLLTVCALEKIDACPMEGFETIAYDDLLGLDKMGLSSVLVLPIGYRAADDMFADFKKVRRSLQTAIIEL